MLPREAVALEQSFPARDELERSFSTVDFRLVEEVYRVVLVAKECPLAACLDVLLRAAVQDLDWSIVGGDYPRLEKKQMHECVERRENPGYMGVEVGDRRALEGSAVTQIIPALHLFL
jgi:hypothetical protein